MDGVERPLDLLNTYRGKKVEVTLKNSDVPVEATLVAFDIHINLALETETESIFIRGDVIETIKPKN